MSNAPHELCGAPFGARPENFSGLYGYDASPSWSTDMGTTIVCDGNSIECRRGVSPPTVAEGWIAGMMLQCLPNSFLLGRPAGWPPVSSKRPPTIGPIARTVRSVDLWDRQNWLKNMRATALLKVEHCGGGSRSPVHRPMISIHGGQAKRQSGGQLAPLDYHSLRGFAVTVLRHRGGEHYGAPGDWVVARGPRVCAVKKGALDVRVGTMLVSHVGHLADASRTLYASKKNLS